MPLRTIWDLGAHDGADLDYYLMKADRVIAVEAMPHYCQKITREYSKYIHDQKLIVINKVLVSDSAEGEERTFFVHKTRPGESSLCPPETSEIDQFETISLQTLSIENLALQYPDPWYIKIDLEGYDKYILTCLSRLGIMPEFISAEVQDLDVVAILTSQFNYSSFNLVNGRTLARDYGNTLIKAFDEDKRPYAFSANHSGPFGQDINKPWMDRETIHRLLAVEGAGWKDIHASSSIRPGIRSASLYWILFKSFLISNKAPQI